MRSRITVGSSRAAFTERGGVEVDTQGDAFFYAFTRAGDAVEAASAGQESLAQGPLRVRIGVHTGEPLVTAEGYVGIDVHRAARIAAAAHGGQVVLSQTTRDLVDDIGLRDLGVHRLKDLTAPERSISSETTSSRRCARSTRPIFPSRRARSWAGNKSWRSSWAYSRTGRAS